MNSLKKSFQKGFTIVELLIVIVVIGILAALVITTYNGIQQKGRNTDRTNDVGSLSSQLEAYYALNAHYPTTTDLGSTSTSNVTFISTNMKGLDKEALRDPKAAKDDFSLGSGTTGVTGKYQYKSTDDAGNSCDNATTDCTKFTLVAKPEGTGDDIKKNSLN